MIFSDLWARVTKPVSAWQLDQTVNTPWYVPAFFALGAFVITWLRVELALPLVILAAAADRYRFDVAGAGLRVEHFVFAGAGLAWVLKTRPALKQLHFRRADLLLAAFLGVTLASSLLYAPLARESLKFFGLMCYGVVLYVFFRAAGAHAQAFTRAVWVLIAVGVDASAFGIAAWLVFPSGINLGVQTYSLGTFETFLGVRHFV
jgi:hypothetical protein